MAVDPGEKNLGLAISDPSGTIANPLGVIKHVSHQIDAATIVQIAQEQEVVCIIIGQALDDDGQLTLQARRANHLTDQIRFQSSLLVELWDESGSTQSAREARIAMGVTRKNRQGHLDQLAATVVLQSFLDAQEHRHV